MKTLFGIAAIIAAALVGDGIRRAGRAFEMGAETDALALQAELGLVEFTDHHDDDEPETVH